MKRLAILFGPLIAWTAIVPSARAASYTFTIGGHRFHVEAARNCRSTSCVSVSSRTSWTTDAVGTTSAPPPAPVVQVPQPVYPIAPVRPAQATIVAPPALVLAATTSQPAAPPAPQLETLSPTPPRLELSRLDPPKTLAPPPPEPPVANPDPRLQPAANVAPRSDDEQAYLPLGEWESDGAKGTVRIERCGPALCGFALTETSARGESVLVNMKPKAHDVWTGSIYSRSSGNTYYATMRLKSRRTLYVEACALGRFWCSGNDWTRIEARPDPLIATSRQWGARS
ncbi:DUF2147 domain-containing protein [Bradyrhizobium sp. INPA01-394B]|uniref:DUF2147 domain-containing protein n=1 Tax=Bradyrhizobium campsiandrae TaxID=1729892 RepID=A0ABR7UER8_9BRAD|nr:DUF2147 domain-containing protein [Bradyrhizobium campsiandrae]MBC9883037.1 DUF2147 domain-containing protein [Bradyrhizobium campsiandrae]MBC9982595.1 DUF2147 domain-containing protein [Bradyrhizobium campsiandrae]